VIRGEISVGIGLIGNALTVHVFFTAILRWANKNVIDLFSHRLMNGAARSFKVTAFVLVVVHNAGGNVNGLGFGEVAFIHFGFEGFGEPEAGLRSVGGSAGGPAGVAAKDKEFVDGGTVDEAADKVAGGVGVDRPGPAQVGPDVFVVFGQGDEFVAVGVGNVHEYKAGVEVFGQEGTEVAGLDAADRHTVVASIITGMEFEGEVVFY